METTSHRTGNDIAVTVHRPHTQAPAPVIVLCHGFCGIQELLLRRFAEAFVLAGYAAVTFDYRGFGASGGEQGRLVPSMQIEDIHTVVAFVTELPGIDAARVGLWGTSLGGGHVLAAAASPLFHEAGLRDPTILCEIPAEGGDKSDICRWWAELFRSMHPHLESFEVSDGWSIATEDILGRLEREAADTHAQVEFVGQICAWAKIRNTMELRARGP
jgi:fermentation-respiration switch protein FrsA (DUF1100 family)